MVVTNYLLTGMIMGMGIPLLGENLEFPLVSEFPGDMSLHQEPQCAEFGKKSWYGFFGMS